MDLTALDLDEFLCAKNSVDAPSHSGAFDEIASHIGEKHFEIGKKLHDCGKGYTVHQLGASPSNVVLLHEDNAVGIYQGETLAIKSCHTGKGLSVPLVLAAVPHRPLPDKRIVSEAGKAALTRAWKVANGKSSSCWWP